MKSIVKQDRPLVSPPTSYKGSFMDDVRKALCGVGLINMDNKYGLANLEKGQPLSPGVRCIPMFHAQNTTSVSTVAGESAPI